MMIAKRNQNIFQNCQVLEQTNILESTTETKGSDFVGSFPI